MNPEKLVPPPVDDVPPATVACGSLEASILWREGGREGVIVGAYYPNRRLIVKPVPKRGWPTNSCLQAVSAGTSH